MSSAPLRPFARPQAPADLRAPGIGRGLAWTLAASAAIGFAWAGTATWYILCRDDFVQTFLARQTEMRIAYEDRVGDLKTRLEREITSGLVERRAFGSRVEALVTRQSEIEARQIWLSGLAERVGELGPGPRTTGSIETGLRSPSVPTATIPTFPAAAGAAAAAPGKPMPMPAEPFDLRLKGRGEEAAPQAPDRLSALEQSLRRASDEAVLATDGLRRGVRDKAAAMRGILAGTRAPVPPAVPRRDSATGGPFIPAPAALDAAAFAPLAADAEEVVAELEQVVASARSLPIGRPLAGDVEQTSGFGYRLDPFTRATAVHSGVDFRAAHGAPVRATAGGRVATAEYSGGYGNMVEVEHENGLSTRYGHLSAISVAVGQKVEAGQVVGRAGSTGRSTGTHLHYETRVDGEAVDPIRFLEAGRLLARMR